MLWTPLAILGIGINEEYLTHAFRRFSAFFSHNHNASRNGGAIEQIGRKADDRLQPIPCYKILANQFLHPTTKEDTVRHHRCNDAAEVEYGEHMLHEHQISFFAGFEAEMFKAILKLHIILFIILNERRIAENIIEEHQHTA